MPLPGGRRRAVVATSVPVAAVVAGLVATWMSDNGYRLLLHAPPFFGHYDLQVGPGTPLAVAVAVAVVGWGPQLAGSLRWRVLLLVAPTAALAFAVALALVEGTAGITRPLSEPGEYLNDVSRVHDVTGFLSGFVGYINTNGSPDHWSTHVAGHPPLLLLVLAGLRAVGLGGATPAALLCLLVGVSATTSTLVAVRNVAGEALARSAAPYLTVAPAAIWVAVSGDALILGVTAACVALLTAGGAARAALGGVIAGFALLLSYGVLTFLVLPAVLLARRRRPWLLGVAAATGVGVLGAVGLLGFNYLDGLHATLIRYSAGAGGYRPYGYYVVGNLVVLAVCVGPATVAAWGELRRRDPLLWLVGPTTLAVLAADLSGKSKAEVERIWLMFVPWLLVACARLPHPRRWLAVQAGVAVLLETVLRSPW